MKRLYFSFNDKLETKFVGAMQKACDLFYIVYAFYTREWDDDASSMVTLGVDETLKPGADQVAPMFCVWNIPSVSPLRYSSLTVVTDIPGAVASKYFLLL